MKKRYLFSLALTTALFIVPSAMATSLDANGMALTELQGVFDGIGSTLNANTDESGSEVFAFQSTGATAHYVATVSYTASDLQFGIFDLQNTANRMTIFDTAAPLNSTPGDNTQIYIDYNGSTAYSYFLDTSIPGPPVQTNIDSINMMLPSFGFYITTTYGTYYSVSDFNSTGIADLDGDGLNDNDHFLTYEGKGDQVTLPGVGQPLNDYAHWYLAIEGTPINGSSDDFSDFVVQLESMQPIPEPTTMLLFGTGLVGLTGLARRRRK